MALVLTEEETRRCKLYHLVVDVGGAVLRYRFDQKIPNPSTELTDTSVKMELTKLLKDKFISKTQYDLLYPITGTSSSNDYDITLLVALHRTLLSTKKRIWKIGNTPAPTDFSAEAEIVRLRDFRNKLLHPPRLGGLSKADFDAYWKNICGVLLRFGSGMTGLKDRLEPLKNDCLDKMFEKALLDKLEEWQKMDEAFGDEILRTIQSNSHSDIALERSKRELSDVLDDTFFVKTYNFQKAKDILNEKGIIVIKGAQGEGKTTMGKKLVEHPDRCLKINRCSDLDIRNNSKIDAVLIDDMFGCNTFNKGESRKWLKYIPQIKDDVQNKRLKVIITSRSYILDEVLEKMYVSHLINESNTLTISSKDLTDDEKRSILEKHIEMNERELEESHINECIAAANDESAFVIGFPECARLFCQHEQFFKEKCAFFKCPMAHIKTCLVDIFQNEQVFLAFFVLWAQKSQEITLLSLEQTIDNSPKSILGAIEQLQFRPEDMLRTIRASLLKHKTDFIIFDASNEIFSFSHRVLSDAVGLVAYEKNGTAVLQYCDLSFIERYIRTEDNTRDGNPAENSADDTTGIEIAIHPLRYQQLCSRIGEIVKDMNNILTRHAAESTVCLSDNTCRPEQEQPSTQYLKCVPLLHPAFQNTQFCKMFLKETMKGKTLDLLTTPVSTVRVDLVGLEKVLDKSILGKEICLLGFLLKNSMTQFASVCYQEMVSIKCNTGENCPVTEVLKTDLLISTILAIKRGDQNMIEYLAKLDAPVDDQNVILTAFKMGNREILSVLLDLSDKTVSAHRKDGKSPLILFVEENNIEAVKCLLDKKHFYENELDFQSEVDPCSETALHKACKGDQDEIVELLLQAKPNLLLRDVNGYCPIHVAALAGNVKMIKRLLEHNMKQADYPVNLSDNLRHIKLYHIAVFHEYADVIDLLEGLGVSPGCMDDEKKQSPLLLALQERKCRIVKKMTGISIKHDVHAMPDHRGNTALHIAIEKVPDLEGPGEFGIYREIISKLCQNGIEVRLPNDKGKSALQLAEENNLDEIVAELLKYEINNSSLFEQSEAGGGEQSSSRCDEVIHTPAKRAKHA